MSDRPQIRTATRGDVPEILDVLRESLGETPLLRRTTELFSWKHFENPFGESLILLAELGSRLAGVRAFMRWRLETPGGDSIECVRAVDTATRPEFQGRGVFRALTMSALDAAREQGVHLVFNTPNEKSAPGYLKMGWGEVGWIRPVLRPRLGLSASQPNGELVSLSEVIPMADQFAVPRSFRQEPLGLRTPRNAEYQRWRYTGHPTARYGWAGDEDGGAVVRSSVRKGRTELLVSDITPRTEVLRTVRRSHRARYVATAFSQARSPEARQARRAGLFGVPGVGGLRLVANPLTDVDIDVFDLASWDISLSDLELL